MKTTTKTTSRRTFVKTIDGEKLELTKTRLKQIPQADGYISSIACYLTFANLRKANIHNREFGLTVNFNDSKKADVSYTPQTGGLGCCNFDEKTFNKIMKAAGSHIRFGQPVAPIV